MTVPLVLKPQTLRCRACDVPIIRVISTEHVELLQAMHGGYDYWNGRIRLVVRCANCGQRRRLPVEDARHC